MNRRHRLRGSSDPYWRVPLWADTHGRRPPGEAMVRIFADLGPVVRNMSEAMASVMPTMRRTADMVKVAGSAVSRLIALGQLPPGCCPDCDGTGYADNRTTSGLCWTCRGTAHPHDGPCESPDRTTGEG